MTLPYQEIARRCKLAPPMVFPFHERTVFNGMTYGVGPAGYDIRISETLWLFPMVGRLASSIEKFHIPSDIIAEVKDKSTWARRFVFVQNTVIEPGWCGYLTLELTNDSLLPVKIYAGTPIAQVLFRPLVTPTDKPYKGKYQNQKEGAQKLIWEAGNK